VVIYYTISIFEGLGETTRQIHFLSKIIFSWNIVHGRNIYILVEKSEKSVYYFQIHSNTFKMNNLPPIVIHEICFAFPERFQKVDLSR